MNVVQDRLLGKIEADHVRHVRIDGLVVRHAGADRVGKGHPARPVRGKETRHAQHRVGTEGKRVEKVVVHPPIDDMHALRTARGPHINRIVLDEKILTFDQLDPICCARNACSK